MRSTEDNWTDNFELVSAQLTCQRYLLQDMMKSEFHFSCVFKISTIECHKKFGKSWPGFHRGCFVRLTKLLQGEEWESDKLGAEGDMIL
jgi:hypothetical protein